MTKLDLDTRIADAFAAAQTSGHISHLIDEATAAEAKARDEFALSKQTALDPATRPEALTTARKGMAEAEFAIARLQAATTKLKALLKTTQLKEQNAQAQARLDAALKERDALAIELAEKYPRLAGELIDLLKRIDRNRAALANRYPDAELVARGLPENFRVRPHSSHPTILEHTRLADWNGGGANMGQMWPQMEMRRAS